MNQQLAGYVENQLRAGVGKEDIKKALRGAGWSDKDIEDALAGGGGGASAPATPATPQTPSAVLAKPEVSAAPGTPDVTPKETPQISPAALGATLATPATPATPGAEKGRDIQPLKIEDIGEKPPADLPSQTFKGNKKSSHKLPLGMMVMGVVVVLLVAALVFLYFFMQGRASRQAEELRTQITALTAEIAEMRTRNTSLTEEVTTLTQMRETLLDELSFLVAVPELGSAGSERTVTVMGTLRKVRTNYILTTAHGVAVTVANSSTTGVMALLDPVVEGGTETELTGTYELGSDELTVTHVGGVEVEAPTETE